MNSFCHCEEQSDEAILHLIKNEIAAVDLVNLATTLLRGRFFRPLLLTTEKNPVNPVRKDKRKNIEFRKYVSNF